VTAYYSIGIEEGRGRKRRRAYSKRNQSLSA
jgi:hypothetical protein